LDSLLTTATVKAEMECFLCTPPVLLVMPLILVSKPILVSKLVLVSKLKGSVSGKPEY
jgi:hypothetical protein